MSAADLNEVQWRRRGVPDYDVVRRWSLMHVVRGGNQFALCGVPVQWVYVGAGDGTRCLRCAALRERADRLIGDADAGG